MWWAKAGPTVYGLERMRIDILQERSKSKFLQDWYHCTRSYWSRTMRDVSSEFGPNMHSLVRAFEGYFELSNFGPEVGAIFIERVTVKPISSHIDG